MAELINLRQTCEARGCIKAVRCEVRDAAGVRVGRFCGSCGSRAYVRERRKEGHRPFAGVERTRRSAASGAPAPGSLSAAR